MSIQYKIADETQAGRGGVGGGVVINMPIATTGSITIDGNSLVSLFSKIGQPQPEPQGPIEAMKV